MRFEDVVSRCHCFTPPILTSFFSSRIGWKIRFLDSFAMKKCLYFVRETFYVPVRSPMKFKKKLSKISFQRFFRLKFPFVSWNLCYLRGRNNITRPINSFWKLFPNSQPFHPCNFIKNIFIIHLSNFRRNGKTQSKFHRLKIKREEGVQAWKEKEK